MKRKNNDEVSIDNYKRHKHLISWLSISPDIWANVFSFLKTQDLINNIQVSQAQYQVGKRLGQSRLWQPVRKHFFAKPEDPRVILNLERNLFPAIRFFDNQLVIGNWDGTLEIWERDDSENWLGIAFLKGHTQFFWDIISLADGRLVSASEDSTLRIWQKIDKKWQCVAVLAEHQRAVKCIAILSDHSIVSGSRDTTVRLWREVNHHWESITLGHMEGIISIMPLPDGGFISTSHDSRVRVWRKRYDELWDFTLLGEGRFDLRTAIFLENIGIISLDENEGRIRIWHEIEGIWQEVQLLNMKFAFDPYPYGFNSHILALADGGLIIAALRSISIWNKTDGEWQCIKKLPIHPSIIKTIHLLSDGRLVVGGADGSLCFWHPRNDGGFDASFSFKFESLIRKESILSIYENSHEEISVLTEKSVYSINLKPALGLSYEFESRP